MTHSVTPLTTTGVTSLSDPVRALGRIPIWLIFTFMPLFAFPFLIDKHYDSPLHCLQRSVDFFFFLKFLISCSWNRARPRCVPQPQQK